VRSSGSQRIPRIIGHALSSHALSTQGLPFFRLLEVTDTSPPRLGGTWDPSGTIWDALSDADFLRIVFADVSSAASTGGEVVRVFGFEDRWRIGQSVYVLDCGGTDVSRAASSVRKLLGGHQLALVFMLDEKDGYVFIRCNDLSTVEMRNFFFVMDLCETKDGGGT
jgi:hypothetical protein